ncbi:MAG: hypothetical protein EXQ70_06885 [Solirubrobacterales bacterium]|nr:hypothetical protein [Solirubrobacterales bacterium]
MPGTFLRCFPIVGSLLVFGALAFPGSAGAAISCVHDAPPTGLIDVILSSNDAVRLEVVGNKVQVQDGAGAPIACTGGAATVAGTTAIDVTDGSGGGGIAPSLLTIVDPTELSGAAIVLDLRGGSDRVEFRTTSGPLNLRFGALGVNTNPSDYGGLSP